MCEMKRKIFKSDVESLRLQGREIMNSSIDSRFYNRVAAVNAVLSGVSPNVACEWFNMTSRSLTGWVKKVDEQGFESLRDKVRPGAPKKLNTDQMKKLDTIIQRQPTEYGFNVWDGNSLSELIENTFHVKLGVRQCQRLFHKLGYVRIRPQTFPSKGVAQSEARDTFQKKEKK